MTSTSTVELIEAHPSLLQLETNIRTEATLDAGFVASIRANGVLTPVLGHRNDDGTVTVRAGQRRILAARQAGLETVPVYLVPVDGEGVEDERIIHQLVENEHRDSMTSTDRLAAYKKLELAGLSVTAIAKRTGTTRATVKTTLAVAGNNAASEAHTSYGLTLDQAAELIEFADDPATVAQLTETAEHDPGYFPHALAQARARRERAAVRQAVEQSETEKGHRILDVSPAYGDAPHPLRRLLTADGEPVAVEDIQGKDGVAVVVRVWNLDEPELTYYVDDPDALGYTTPEYPQYGTPGASAQSGPMTDEQKIARRELMANNREWDAAVTVRREWIARFLSRKTLPKDAPAVIATLLTRATYNIANNLSATGLAKQFLSMDEDYKTTVNDYLTANPTRAMHVNLAVILAAAENATDRGTWRYPRDEHAHYLRALADWGYTLCHTETTAAMLDTADAAAEAEAATAGEVDQDPS
jgi:ParB family chromosome partitioning protein